MMLLLTALLTMTATAAAAPIQAGGFPVAVRDAAGREIVVPAAPRRIVSLAPSVTEILFALGLDEEIVGISDADDYPPDRLTGRARVGGTIINLERVVALRPDLVIGLPSIQRDQLARLEAARLRVVGVDAATVAETLAQISLVGQVTGRSRQAAVLLQELGRRIAAVRPRARRLVYIEAWHEPLIAAATGTLVDDMAGRAGGVNVFAGLRGYPQVAGEVVIARNPQVILLLYPAGPLGRRPGWERIDAVRARRVRELPTSLVARPGPRVADGLYLVARALQGPP